jgi:hypothetical protein
MTSPTRVKPKKASPTVSASGRIPDIANVERFVKGWPTTDLVSPPQAGHRWHALQTVWR